jgi:hypothetical protein
MTFAINLSKKKPTNRARVERLLTLVAFDNHSNIEGADLKPLRLFETGTVTSILSSEPNLAAVGRDLSTSDEIPLVKTVQLDYEELECAEETGILVALVGIGGLYQFAHMSLQEFVFVKHLIALYPTCFPEESPGLYRRLRFRLGKLQRIDVDWLNGGIWLNASHHIDK